MSATSSHTPIELRFSVRLQRPEALQEAAYRLIGTAAAHMELQDEEIVVRLELQPGSTLLPDALQRRFLDLVTDENLRAKVAAETEGVRNVVLALAFGALAREPAGAPAE